MQLTKSQVITNSELSNCLYSTWEQSNKCHFNNKFYANKNKKQFKSGQIIILLMI